MDKHTTLDNYGLAILILESINDYFCINYNNK